MLSLPIFFSIFAMLIGIDYFNDNGWYYNQSGVLRLVKITSISTFFSIIWSISTIYTEKIKIKKIVYKFELEFNQEKSTDELSFMHSMSNKIARNIPEEIKKIKSHYGEIKKLEIQTICFILKGIHTKTTECNVFCIILFSLEKNENIIFNFQSINNGDLKLQNITFSTVPELSEAQKD